MHAHLLYVHLRIILLQPVWVAKELRPYSSSVHLPQWVDPLEVLLVVTHLTDGDFMTVDWRGRRGGRSREEEEQGGE